MKNKAKLKEVFRPGKEHFDIGSFSFRIIKDPQGFANSDELKKIQNRNRKRRN